MESHSVSYLLPDADERAPP